MDKKIPKQFVLKIWDKMNVLLFVATVINVLPFLILFVACFIIQIGSDLHGMVLGMCGVFASLSSAFFLAWIIRFYDMKKKQEQEFAALQLISPHLSEIYSTINEFFPLIKNFTTIKPDDTIDYPKEIIYYTDPSKSERNLSFTDLNAVFKSSYSDLNKKLTACLNEPILFQCNEEVIKLLTGIKQNKLAFNLREISNFPPSIPNLPKVSYYGIYKNYNEFFEYYEALSKLVSIKSKGKLVELGDKEKAEYIKEIEMVKKEIPIDHEGRMYLGGIRIQ